VRRRFRNAAAGAGARGDLKMPLDYVLVTPARNEAAFVRRTLESVVAQTVLPKRWVVVSDGSTDDTDAIVEEYRRGRSWLELVRLPPRTERDFAAKARAVGIGYARVAPLAFDVVGNLDADVSFGPDFMEYLLAKFAAMPRLGVASTYYREGDFHSWRDSWISETHVTGQVQLFRRDCFEEIGGYVPSRGGGVDWIAETTARMKGWETRSFGERTFEHHRKSGTAGGSELRARFDYGLKDWFLGGHPLWQLGRGAFQMTKRPYVVGGLGLLAGYAWGFVTRRERAVSDELTRFHRAEQLARLRLLARRPLDAVRRASRAA